MLRLIAITAQKSSTLLLLDALMITTIAMVKANGEMMHPAIIPTSKHCHAVLNSGVEKLNCKSPKKAFINSVIDIGTLKKSNAAQRSSCGTEPYTVH